MRKMEILAPAGTFDALVAAVRCGANAIYLGSQNLNARRGAGNFDREELERAIRYCHARDVKIYQTLNILLFDEEIPAAVDEIREAARLGIDGLITQDLAMARLARQCAPQLPIHASTQMAIHNLAGVREAEKLGFTRVVLARELTQKEIRYITENTDLEIEVFVHGALCMCVSGQCYLSSMIGERSGNRGLCAQPCRLPFQAKGGSEYGLSLKDLTLADRMEELERCGVASLKIEGRMKRPEYVAASVTAIRKAMAGEAVDFDELRSVFSRSGFTRGYFDGTFGKEMFGVRQKEDVVSAQGVLKDLARLFDREQPLVPVDMDLQIHADEPAVLTLFDKQGHVIEAQGDVPQVALNKPTDAEKARQNLSKTGGTPYYISDLECDIDDGLMLPASSLNAMRREALEKLEENRQVLHPFPFEEPELPHPFKTMNLKYPVLRARLTGAQLTDYIAGACDKLILPIGDINNVLARGVVKDPAKIIAEIPRMVFRGEEALVEKLTELKELGVTKVWAGNLGALQLAKDAGMEICGGFSLNITNSEALRGYQELGVTDTEVSFELSLTKAKQLGDYMPYGILAYGYLPLMILRNCPIRAAMGCDKCKGYETLTDRKGVRFAVDCGGTKVSELFNSVPLWLADRMNELEGFSFLTLYFTREDRRTCEQIVRAYENGDAMAGPKEGKTRGLYYRNVL